MSDRELKAYAANLGISGKALDAADDKVEFVSSRWEKKARVTVAGETFEVPAKVVKSKEFIDLLGAGDDAKTEQAMRMLVGEDGMSRIAAMATDDDGTVDVAAVGTICGLILNDRKLKNF